MGLNITQQVYGAVLLSSKCEQIAACVRPSGPGQPLATRQHRAIHAAAGIYMCATGAQAHLLLHAPCRLPNWALGCALLVLRHELRRVRLVEDPVDPHAYLERGTQHRPPDSASVSIELLGPLTGWFIG